MTGYIIDDSVLIAGLTGAGQEHHRRELSRLMHGAIDICGLARTGHLDALRAFHPGLSWPATHTAAHALTTGLPVLTTEPERYANLGVNSLRL